MDTIAIVFGFTRRVMGKVFWSCDSQKNKTLLEELLRDSYHQNLSEKDLNIDDFFVNYQYLQCGGGQ